MFFAVDIPIVSLDGITVAVIIIPVIITIIAEGFLANLASNAFLMEHLIERFDSSGFLRFQYYFLAMETYG